MNYHVFLRWALIAVLSFVGATICYQLGMIDDMIAQDASKISIVILAAYGIMTIICGKQSYKLSTLMHDKDLSANTSEKTEAIIEQVINVDLDEIRKGEETGWFIAKSFFSLGMIGTIIGFMMAFCGLADLDPSDVGNLKMFMGSMTNGITTALITTLVGLSCGLLLQFQYYNLSHARRSIIEDKEEK